MEATGVLLVFCLFSSILSTVTSLKCEMCVGLGEDCGSFNTKVVECKENEEFCSTVLGNTSITNIAERIIIKDCAAHRECMEGVFTSTTVDGRFEIARGHCCQTDACNAEPLPLPDYDELQQNGLKCPGCYALDANHCEANQTVNCVGNENQCIAITIIKDVFGNYTEKFSYQGCTTENSCAFPPGSFEMAVGQIQINVTAVECRNASSSELHFQ